MDGRGDGRGALTAAGPSCGVCGFELPPSSKFCNECGAPITPATTQAEYKQVTVLFADVVHSMEIAATVGAERLREIMAELADRCAAVVQRYGGTVDKFTGDGIMAVFGAPIAFEDHAIRACLAALGIQEEIARLAADVDSDRIELKLRVGLNSGQVIAGEIGSGALGYTTIGEQVGMAQRMESVAPPGGVMLSASTARLVDEAAVLSEPEVVRIKGTDISVGAHRLLSMGERHRGIGRADSNLVGRRWEMSAVESLLDRAIEGHGAVVGIVGPPGIGKSRLLRELSAMASTRGVEVFTTFCESHTSQIPFHAVARLLRVAFGVEGLDMQLARDGVRDRISEAVPEDLLLLYDLLGIADPGASLPAMDPDARRRRLTALVNAASLARQTPAVFVVEDAHWIDEVSESMLADFLTVTEQTPSLVVVSYRPEYDGALARVYGSQTIALAPLSNSESAALVAELLGTDESIGELRHTIAERAAGNPFFAEEIVRDLAERGVLTGRAGAYLSTAHVSEAKVPATLQATIAARIDRLDSRAKRTLGAAAVIGSHFDLELLTELGVEPVVDELAAAHLINQVKFTRQPEYVFHNPLIRAVAYEAQLKSDRAQLHRNVAAAIAARDPAAAEEKAALIAEHLEAAGDLHGAYTCHMRAAAWATNRDITAAHVSWERARQIADALPVDTAGAPAMRIAPRSMLCGTAWRVLGSAGSRFEELRQLCAANGDKSSLAIGMTGLVMEHALYGRVREGSLLADEHMELVDSIGDPTLTVGLSFVPIIAKHVAGEMVDVLRRSQLVIDMADGDPTKGNLIIGSPLAWALATRGIARWVLGYPGWRTDFDEAVAMARSTDPLSHAYVVHAAYGLGIPCGLMLADDAALVIIEEALQNAERWADDHALISARAALSLALMHRDSPADRECGRAMAEKLREFTPQEPTIWTVNDVYVAREMARNGDRDGAVPLLRAAANRLFDTGNAGVFVTTMVLVEVLLDRDADGDVEEATSTVERLAAVTGNAVAASTVILLRMQALLAHALGDQVAYRDYLERYRAMATTLDLEGHIEWAKAMP